MSADLLVIVPSRERPQNIDALVGAWRETSAGHANRTVGLDDDEPMEYPVLDDVLYVHGPRQQLCGWTNTIATQHASQYRYLGSIGDDHRPRTRHWDAVICDALADLGTGIVYGDDLLRGAELCTAAFMTSDIVLRLGYMCPPGFVHLDVDH